MLNVLCGFVYLVPARCWSYIMLCKLSWVFDQFNSLVYYLSCFRSGALHAGDHLLAIDGTDLGHMSAAEVEHFLVTGESKVIQLEILPVGHLMKEQPSTISEVPQANPSIGKLSILATG